MNSIQMLFSNSDSESETETAAPENNALSFYLEEGQWSRLLELVNEYGHFEITKENADKFLLKLGSHHFSIVRNFHKSMITMLDISTITPGAAELLAKIADLIFYDRKRRFMLSTNRIDYEQITWTVCQKLNIPLKPADKGQAERFQTWTASSNMETQLKAQGFAQTMLNENSQIESNDPQPKS